jgi:homogentisate 1,2-dioxygenase
VRDETALLGTLTEASLRPLKVRPFDYFAGMTGTGRVKAPVIFAAPNLKVDVYNTSGEQWAFHRNLEHDELWFHFAGASHNDTEFGSGKIGTGEMAVVPHGIGHRTTGSPPPRMLLVIYHNYPVRLSVDPNARVRRTEFAVEPQAAPVAAAPAG